MSYLGLLSLGAFVGGLLITGIDQIRSLPDFRKVVTTILGAACSGGVLVFLESKETGEALYMYPVGLLLALLWFYGSIAMANIRAPDAPSKLLGWTHIIALASLNILVLVLVAPSVVSDVWDSLAKH